MKINLRKKSIKLRQKGHSIKEIAEMLLVAQGSVSTWVRDVVLSPEQKLKLKMKNHSPEVVERRRQSRLANEKLKKNIQINEAAGSIEKIDLKSLKILGLGLYWGEGAKTTKGMARISNSDPAVVMMCMRFFREICHVPEHRFRAHIHIHSVDAIKEAEKYWSKVVGLPLSQFYKTYAIKSKSSKNIRKTLPYGTLDIGVADTKLLLKILGWIEGLKRQVK
jgi:transposase